MVKAMPEDIKQEANKVVNVDFTGQEQWRNDLKLDGNGGIR
ncbi:phage protein, partial [Lacticaseibacillus paracasei subsp. paracasei Lpp219]